MYIWLEFCGSRIYRVGVINDGTPINIYVSSGSGTASVRILAVRLIAPLTLVSTDLVMQEEYTTKGGTQWYSHVPVSL